MQFRHHNLVEVWFGFWKDSVIKQIQYQYISKLTLLVTRLLKYAESLLPLDSEEDEQDTSPDFLESSPATRPHLDIHKIENDFMSEMNRMFAKLLPAKGTRLKEHDLHLADLSLLEDEELKENIVIDSIVAKANLKNEVELKRLSQRLATIVTTAEVDKKMNPFRPRNICKCFQHAIRHTDLTTKQRIYLYERFDSVVLFELEEIFKNINEQMKSAGILPELEEKPQVVHTKSIDRPRYDDNKTRVDQADKSEDLLGALQGLMKQSSNQAQSSAQTVVTSAANISTANGNVSATSQPIMQQQGQGTVSSNAPVVEVNQSTLIQALNEVQQMHVEIASLREAQRHVGSVKTKLTKSIQASNPQLNQRIGSDSENVIDIVSMIFDFVFDDDNLPDEFKALIGRLQIPIIKVALLDPTFMNMGQHPARRLVNKMAHACVGWSEEQGMGLKEKMTELVNRIVNEFDDDIQLFEDVLQEFVEFYETHNHRVILIERRLKEAEEGKALQEQAMRQATSAIKKIKSGYVLPDSVDRFLEEDWYNLMTLSFLREGRSSMMWQQYLDTGKALVKSLFPIRSQSDRAIHKLKAADLINELRKGLDVLGQDEFESRGLFSELNKLHDNVRDGQRVISTTVNPDADTEELESLDVDLEINEDDESAREVAANYEFAGDVEQIDITETPEEDDSELQEWLNVVTTLQSGIWFTRHVEATETRCKLAAVITTVGKYIFVNNAGRKIDEYTKLELATALKDKQLVQLDDGALFERALKKIVTNFKERQYETDKEWQ